MKSEKTITFLIGNGFDVGMGMKSQYADFYKEFIKKGGTYYPQSGDNRLVRRIRYAQRHRLPHWSYYEKWFGNQTKICDGDIWEGKENASFREELLKQNEEFQERFYKYLEDQENALETSGLGAKMLDGLRNYYSRDNIGKDEEDVRVALNEDTDPMVLPNRRKYQFVCFNYSGVIDRSVDALKKERQKRYNKLIAKIKMAYAAKKAPVITKRDLSIFMEEHHDKVISTVEKNKSMYCDGQRTLKQAADDCAEALEEWFNAETIGIVHHGHGALRDPERSVRVMGVNDDTQIGENFREDRNRSYSNRMVKRKIMVSAGKKDQYDTTIEMIRSSDVIVVYGMSIGDTDKDYWAELYNWLKEHPNRQLIFYMYDSSYEPLRPNDQKQIVTDNMKQFREMSWKLNEEVKWCGKTGERFHFMPNNCPERFGKCTTGPCVGQNLAKWCADNGLAASDFSGDDKLCEMECCPEYEQCKDWIGIRKRIHFAIHKNIFSLEKSKTS